MMANSKRNGEQESEKGIALEGEVVEPTPTQTKEAMARIDTAWLLGLNLLEFAKLAVQSKFFAGAEGIAQAAMKIAMGHDMGLKATTALRHLYVVHGRLGVQGELMAAKIRESGRYDYEVIKSTDEECQIDFYRVGSKGTKKLGESKFTLADAKKAGLIKEGSGWTSYPSDMLFWRAMSRGQRRYCPDVFHGATVYEWREAMEIPPEKDDHAAPVVVTPDTLGSVVTDAKVEAQNDAPSSYPRASGSASPPASPPVEGMDPFMKF